MNKGSSQQVQIRQVFKIINIYPCRYIYDVYENLYKVSDNIHYWCIYITHHLEIIVSQNTMIKK